MQNGTRLAAVDLGSNSFRLEIGHIHDGQYFRTDYLKETVRLGSGLDDRRLLTADVMQRGLDCLGRFGQQLAGFAAHQVRAVGTQTLREALNRDEFASRAAVALGFPVSVISGREEARLTFQGVAHLLPHSSERRLVLDIGGRSTELVLGLGLEARSMDSYRVGSIVWSKLYFPQGQFTADAFKAAEIGAGAMLERALQTYRKQHWDAAYGSAGTVGAVSDVLTAAGWPSGFVSRDGLNWLQRELVQARSAERLDLPGMKSERRPVIGGGLSILRAVFDLFEIDQLQHASGGLRHGLICDLMDAAGEQVNLSPVSVNGSLV